MWSRVKNIALKTHCFSKKTIVFQHVHFFIPLFWNEKLSLAVGFIFYTIEGAPMGQYFYCFASIKNSKYTIFEP